MKNNHDLEKSYSQYSHNQGCLSGCLSKLLKLLSLGFISGSFVVGIMVYVNVRNNPDKSLLTHIKEQIIVLRDGIINLTFLMQQKTFTYGDSIEGVVNERGEQIPLENIPPSIRKNILEKGTPPQLPKIEGQPTICKTSSLDAYNQDKWQNIKLKSTLIHEDFITDVAFSSDNQYLASGSINHKVYIWDLNTNKLIKSWAAHSDTVTEVKFTPDNKTLISSGTDGKIKFWNWQTGELLKTLNHDKGVTEIILTKDGKQLFTSGLTLDEAMKKSNYELSKQVKLWDTTTGKLIKNLPTEIPAGRLILSKNEDIMIIWSLHTLELRQVNNWQSLGEIYLDIYDSISTANISPDGETLVISRTYSDHHSAKVELIDLKRLPEVSQTPYRMKRLPPPMKTLPSHKEQLFTLDFSPDGRTLFSHGVIVTALAIWDICSNNSPIQIGTHPNASITLRGCLKRLISSVLFLCESSEHESNHTDVNKSL